MTEGIRGYPLPQVMACARAGGEIENASERFPPRGTSLHLICVGKFYLNSSDVDHSPGRELVGFAAHQFPNLVKAIQPRPTQGPRDGHLFVINLRLHYDISGAREEVEVCRGCCRVICVLLEIKNNRRRSSSPHARGIMYVRACSNKIKRTHAWYVYTVV